MFGILKSKVIYTRLFLLLICQLSLSISFGQTAKQFKNAANKSFENGDFYETIGYLNQALKFNKKDNSIHYQIGMSYYELKEYENAIESLKKVSQSIEAINYPFLNFYLGTLYKLEGDYDAAIEYLKKFSDNYRNNDFYSAKSKQEIASCYWAKDQKEKKDIQIHHFKKPLNTGYSEFSATYINGNNIQVTSLQPLIKNGKKSPFQSKIYFYSLSDDKVIDWDEMKSLSNDSLDFANGFYVENNNQFYYTLCKKDTQNSRKCDLYVSQFDNNKFSNHKKLNINLEDYSSSQPTIYFDKDGEEILLFTSNREGGFGKMDIWKASNKEYGVFHSPENLGYNINTIDNESTAFFDSENQILYFSTEWNYGFGGFDIFKSKFQNGTFQKPSNLGLPLNSAANDQYYYLNPTSKKALFSSNRKGAVQMRGAACCFDIFEIEFKEDEITKEEIEELLSNSKENIDKLNELLPATVYFHNDEPNPKTLQVKTSKSYDECYTSFKNLEEEYLSESDNPQAINDFFKQNLENGFNNLKLFLEILEKQLEKNKIEIILEGYCSPLAKNDYNINLAKRRIVSVQNYILNWNNKSLQEFFNEGKLTFKTVPFGEETADKAVSDNYFNTTESIYSVEASKERKVEIIGVKIK